MNGMPNDVSNDGIDSFQELIDQFERLKKLLREENEQKVKFCKEMEFYEQNKNWNNNCLQQLKQELNEQKILFDSQLKSFNELKETNSRLKSSLLEMNSILKEKEELNNGFNSEIIELKNSLETNETKMKELNDCINEKEFIIYELKISLNENEVKNANNMNAIHKSFESKLKDLDKEWSDKYHKCLKSNEQIVIETKANCLSKIEKTKEEYEHQLIELKKQNNELTEMYSHLRLEFEARKMTTPFVNPNKSNNNSIAKNKTTNVATVAPNRSLINESKQRVSIQVLDANEVQMESTVPSMQPKRKKLIPSNDLYLQFLKDET